VKVPRLKDMSDAEIEKVFKLNKKFSVQNFYLFDMRGKIQKYKTVNDILKDFFNIRVDCYQRRKDHMLNQLTIDWKKLQNKVRFVSEVVAEQLIVRNRKKKDITADLLKRGYDRFPPEEKKKKEEKG